MFQLYTTALSENGRKVQAVAGYLGLEPAVRRVNVYQGEGRAADYLAIHPMGKIPALVDDTLTLWESNAILQYMSEAYGDYRLSSRDRSKAGRHQPLALLGGFPVAARAGFDHGPGRRTHAATRAQPETE